MVNFNVKQTDNEDIENFIDHAEAPIKLEVNMTRLENLFKEADDAINLMVTRADGFSVAGPEDMETAIEMANQAKQLFNKIDKRGKPLTGPLMQDFAIFYDSLGMLYLQMLEQLLHGQCRNQSINQLLY